MSSQWEELLLAAVLQDNTRLADLESYVTPEDFDDEVVRGYWVEAVDAVHAGRKVDVFTMAGDDDNALAYLAGLVKNTITANAEAYAERVRDTATKRRVMNKAQALIDAAGDSSTAAEDCVSMFSEAATSLISVGDSSHAKTLSDWMPEVVEDLERRVAGEVVGVRTGYDNLDNLTGGFEGGDLILLAARPGMGKTAFVLNVATKMARSGQMPMIFSIEMPAKQLMYRMAGAIAGVDVSKFRGARFQGDEWRKVMDALRRVEKYGMLVDDRSSLTIGQIRTRVRRAVHSHPVRVVMVDYLGLIRSKKDKRIEAVTEISQGLKEIAREFNVPVIGLSQLNRSCEERQNKRPLPSDLRDSGSLEQDADSILLLYRDLVYDPESPWDDTAELIIGKNRHGPTGVVYYQFDGKNQRFIELDGPPAMTREASEPEPKSFADRWKNRG